MTARFWQIDVTNPAGTRGDRMFVAAPDAEQARAEALAATPEGLTVALTPVEVTEAEFIAGTTPPSIPPAE